MEISEIMFTLGTAIGLNMTHNASFWAESVNAAAWNRARLVEAKLSCFCWYINELMKSTRLENFQREREYSSLAKQVFGSVLFDWDRKGAIYMLWLNFILGLNFIFFRFKLIIIQKIKFKPRIKLNHNIYTARTTNFIFWIQFEKQPLSQTCEDKHC